MTNRQLSPLSRPKSHAMRNQVEPVLIQSSSHWKAPVPYIFSCILWLILSIGSITFIPFATQAAGLNDTGQDDCFNGAELVPCMENNTGDNSPYPRQDGQYGWDARARASQLEKIGGGMAGFDFTALDTNGNPTTPASGARPHPCVRDNVTGLMWEVGLHNMNRSYTWNEANSYVDAVNTASLCGYKDWRLPMPQELVGILNYGLDYTARIDARYFPNTTFSFFWSSSQDANVSDGAWSVHPYYGYVDYHVSEKLAIRLVRGGQVFGSFVEKGDGTVTDTSTELMWAKCSEGQTVPTCTSTNFPTTMNWSYALDAAKNSQLGGHNDWRLPNLKELQSLVDYSRSSPAINPTHFPNTLNNFFWTSTGDLNSVWSVNFGNGLVSSSGRSGSYAVRLVRGGQSFDYLAPINGSCGTANDQSLNSTPTSGFCSAGTPSLVSGSGPWNWICSGSNGGASANCSASVAQPYVDIKVNGQDGHLTIPENTKITLTLFLNPGSWAGRTVDTWVEAETPFGIYYYSQDRLWQQGLPFRFANGQLANLSGQVILNDYKVPAGSYKVTFAVDDNYNGSIENGSIERTWKDSVEITSKKDQSSVGCRGLWHPDQWYNIGIAEENVVACRGPRGPLFGNMQEAHVCEATGWSVTTQSTDGCSEPPDGT